MRKIEQATKVNNKLCVQFRPKVATDVYFITVQNSTGCSATVNLFLFIYERLIRIILRLVPIEINGENLF
jgi:hypothetical protein